MSNLQWTSLSLLVMSSAQLCSAAVGDSIYTIPELLMSGEQINSTCGFVTCDIRMEYCQEMIPGREDKKKCLRCENTCGPGRIQNNPRQRAFCHENCTVYMLSLNLEKQFPNGLQKSKKVGATSTIQMSEGSTLPYMRLAGPSGAECSPYQMLTLVIVIAIFMSLIFICVLLVIIYRKLNKRAGKTLGSNSSLESDANEMSCCALPRGNRNQPVVQPDAVYQARSVQVSLSPPLIQQSAISTTSISPHHGSTVVSSSPPHGSRTSPCTTGSRPSSRDGQLSQGHIPCQGQTSHQSHTAQGHTPERRSSATLDSSSHLMAAHSATPGGSTHATGGSTRAPGGSTSISALRHNTPDEVPDSHRDLSLRSDNITGVSGRHGQPHCESGLSGGPNPWAVQKPIQVSESIPPHQPEGSSYSQQVSTASPVISQPSPHSEHPLSNHNLPTSNETDPFLPKTEPDPETRPKQR